MNIALNLPGGKRDPNLETIIKLTVMAVGGQGGGVLTGWIEQLARAENYDCQATSVAGVAQRTGATIYYVEMAPKSESKSANAKPVFALAPSAGDVDILIAAEMMEAGRAIQRGFVTPDRTTLITSTHRQLAVSEKTVPGDGIVENAEVLAAIEIAARDSFAANMEEIATANGSVISASLFGALAGSGSLPFEREAFERAIRASGRGVEPSLKAFAAGFEATQNDTPASSPTATHEPKPVTGEPELLEKWDGFTTRIEVLPANVRDMALRGLAKVVDFQDLDYGEEYMALLETFVARDNATENHTLSLEIAKYLANAMVYDDVIRVADRKTRASRFRRIQSEMKSDDDNVLHVTEYMHPRAEEIIGMLPVDLGQKLEASPRWNKIINALFNKGRRIRSDSLTGFAMLYAVAGLRNWRPKTLRHKIEGQHRKVWLAHIEYSIETDYAYAVELVRCRRLIKGYSDTHSRGLSKFDRVMQGAKLLAGRKDAADWVARLREAALLDENGDALDGALETVRSFT